MEIRTLRAGDANALRTLCLQATPLRHRLQSERFVLQQAYCQYYLDCEGTNSFTLLEDGQLAGALLCAPNYADYVRRFMEGIYPKCQAYGYSAGLTARQVAQMHKGIAGKYPAHCQCLWPEDRQDLAQPLFEALAAHLETLECRGVCAFPGRKQYALQDALEALGFTYLGKNGLLMMMGKELF